MPEISDYSKVLIVDDSPDALAMLSDALSLEGMDVVVSSSGRQVITLANTTVPDIVLMDAIMPGMDGFETCQILKAARGFQDLPIIFMTRYDESEHVVKALTLGGVDFVSKPILLDQLFARMRVHLGNARRARSARNALDSTGRWIVACDGNGRIGWSTPQASELLLRVGVRPDAGAYLPWERAGWLSEPQPQDGPPLPQALRYSRHSQDVEFRLLSHSQNGEILLRLVDRYRGIDEETARQGLRPDAARGRGAALGFAWQVEQGDRRYPRHVASDREQAHGTDLQQARRGKTYFGRYACGQGLWRE